jgi:microcompartment protein CcmK/EutM
MLIAKVIGTTVATIKDEKLVGRKLLILRETDETGAPSGKPYVAVDTLDAGIGDLVLTAHGSSGRQTAWTTAVGGRRNHGRRDHLRSAACCLPQGIVTCPGVVEEVVKRF